MRACIVSRHGDAAATMGDAAATMGDAAATVGMLLLRYGDAATPVRGWFTW